jgi:hypothetical protein
MTLDINPIRDKSLENWGVEAVRALLAQCGPAEGAAMPMYLSRIEDTPQRGYAERWLARKNGEKQAALDRRDAQMLRWGKIGAWAAIAAAIFSAWPLIVAARNRNVADAQSRALSDAQSVRTSVTVDARYLRLSARSVRRTRDQAARRTLAETQRPNAKCL